MKRFLVTGATGFLGGHLVDKLLAQRQDVQVRILCRGGNRWTSADRVEIVYGDILDVAVVERATRGVDGIFTWLVSSHEIAAGPPNFSIPTSAAQRMSATPQSATDRLASL